MLATAQPVRAQMDPVHIALPAEGLARALDDVARFEGVSILFDSAKLKGNRTSALDGQFAADQAFANVLRGTGLVAKQIAPGSYVVVRDVFMPSAPTIDVPPEGAIPDILVIGRRSGDTDIRRRADDVQPHRILAATDVAQAQAGSTDEFLRDQLASNQVVASPFQQPAGGGKVGSMVNLRGLGTAQTLVLIDGRRVADIPTIQAVLQADITALPLAAIDRVETYSGTAGGLYGPGAIGGVVNLVLKQSSQRLWIEGETGIDSTGDGVKHRITGGLSFSTRDAQSQITVLASVSHDQGLDFEQRGFVAAERLRSDPTRIPVAQNVNVVSADDEPLQLVSALGGRSLGSKIANIPINSNGAGGDETALLLTNAGSWDYRLSADGNGAKQRLLVPFETAAVIASARRKIGDQVEIFADFLMMTDRGSSVTPSADAILQTLPPGAAGNPFQNTITISVSTPGIVDMSSARLTTTRTTLGVIIHLPAGWSAEADAGFGAATDRESAKLETVDITGVDVFSPGAALASALAQRAAAQPYTDHLYDRLRDFNLRAAGQLFVLPGGPLSVTMSGERREEFSPSLQQTPPVVLSNEHGQSVTSILGEARLPLAAQAARLAPLRGLELQLAARADRYSIDVPPDLALDDGSRKSASTSRGTTLALTIGARIVPVAGLTLRGSFATGFQPPSSLDLNSFTDNSDEVTDPKRPGDAPHTVSIITGGSPKLRPELARTLSAGIIAEPVAVPGLRLSIDYMRILIQHEITDDLSGISDFFIAHESSYPDRVVRAPLTSDDLARGYTGGIIQVIDTGAVNSGHSVFEGIDVDLTYAHPFAFGRIGAHASASWVFNYSRQSDPFDPTVQYAGRSDGPLRVKGTAGLDWHHGSLGAAIDVQYFGGYSTAAAGTQIYQAQKASIVRAANIPSQAYIDIGLTSQLRINTSRTISYRFGLKNILNHTPPYVQTLSGAFENWPGYSTYGDPRGRRYVLTVTAGL